MAIWNTILNISFPMQQVGRTLRYLVPHYIDTTDPSLNHLPILLTGRLYRLKLSWSSKLHIIYGLMLMFSRMRVHLQIQQKISRLPLINCIDSLRELQTNLFGKRLFKDNVINMRSILTGLRAHSSL